MSQHVDDAIVIGAAPARKLLARVPGGGGHEVAIVGSDLIGGECLVLRLNAPEGAVGIRPSALAAISRPPGAADAGSLASSTSPARSQPRRG